MDGKARTASVENAFEVKRLKFIKGAKVLLVDDIFTSGATVSNCAKVLKKSGAEKVYVFTLAKTL
jgi:predicted amidophosphoribosyltransferase